MKPFALAGILAAVLGWGARPQAASPGSPAAGSLEAAPSRFASYGGYRVHYKSLGAGRDAVVFVHGLGSDLSVWRYQVPTLAPRSRVVLLDLPGHGRSDRPEQLEYSIRFHALALETVLREAGVSRAVLIGHSMGVAVIREFYRMYPGRTSALVAVDGALRAPVTDPAEIEKLVAPYRGPDFSARLERFADSMLPSASASSAPAWRDDLRRRILATPQPVLVRSMEGMLDPAVWKNDRVSVPLLSVVARNPFWSADYESYVRALGPDVDYRVVDASHFLMLEEPDLFNRILVEFLSKRGLLPRAPEAVTPRRAR
jgi:pimeloyl-ACP methyl ester carboxylesterase